MASLKKCIRTISNAPARYSSFLTVLGALIIFLSWVVNQCVATKFQAAVGQLDDLRREQRLYFSVLDLSHKLSTVNEAQDRTIELLENLRIDHKTGNAFFRQPEFRFHTKSVMAQSFDFMEISNLLDGLRERSNEISGKVSPGLLGAAILKKLNTEFEQCLKNGTRLKRNMKPSKLRRRRGLIEICPPGIGASRNSETN